jgi:hypothetical protein
MRMVLGNYRNAFAATIVAMGLLLGLIQFSCALFEKRGELSDGQSVKSAPVSQEVAIVEFCELLKTPFSYDSRVIRVNATLGRFRDYVTFYDPSCVPKHPLIKVTFSPSFEYDSKSNFTEKLLQIVSGSKDAKEGNVHVFVSAVGLFKAIPPERRKDSTEQQYEFTVTKIENMRG